MKVWKATVERLLSGTLYIEAEDRAEAEVHAKGILESMDSTEFDTEPEDDVTMFTNPVETWAEGTPIWRGGESGGWDFMDPAEASDGDSAP